MFLFFSFLIYIPEGCQRSDFPENRVWDGDVCAEVYWRVCLRTRADKWSRKQDWVGRAVGYDTDTTQASANPIWHSGPSSSQLRHGGLCTPITLRLWFQAAPPRKGAKTLARPLSLA